MEGIFIQNLSVQELKILITEIIKTELSVVHTQHDGLFDFLTRVEASKLLNISLVTLSTWTKTGKIKAQRIGERVYYTKSDIKKSMKTIKGSQTGGYYDR